MRATPDVPVWAAELHAQGRHPSTLQLARWFAYDHLRDPGARQISMHCAALAATMIHDLVDGPELSAGLRKLLEAKDCFVRQSLVVEGVGR
ncbi:MAG: hypothetical protein ACRD0W_00280 [Acidimicrobiales bacterium]